MAMKAVEDMEVSKKNVNRNVGGFDRFGLPNLEDLICQIYRWI